MNRLLVQTLLCVLLVWNARGWESRFEFSGEIYCSKPSFRYHIIVWEWDNLFDDAISTNDVQYSTANYANPHRYSVEAKDYGDGNNWYEIYFQVFHTCTNSGETKMFDDEILGLFPVKDGLNKTIHNFSVENRGHYDPRILGHVEIH